MSKILAAGDDGSFSDFKIVIASTDAGATWAKVTTAISDSGYSVCYADSLVLWVNGADFASTTEQIQTSPDGTSGSWTNHSSTADGSGSVRQIISGPGVIVALYNKSGQGHITTSTDGSTWNLQTLPTNVSIQTGASMAYSPDLNLYCVSPAFDSTGGGTNGVLTSSDASTWTFHSTAPHGLPIPSAMAWGAGLFVIVGGSQGSGEHLYTSPDGVNWTLQADPGGSAQGWDGVHYANGRFVAVSRDISTNPGNQAAYSTNGIAWTIVATPGSSKKWSAVTYDTGSWLAGHSGTGSTQPLMISLDDGATWSLITLGFSYGFINGIASDFIPTPPVVTMGNIWSGGCGQGSGNHW